MTQQVETAEGKLVKEMAIMRHHLARKCDEEVCWQRYNDLLRRSQRSKRRAYCVMVMLSAGAAALNSEMAQMLLHRVADILDK
jgi:hypothetical protein